MIKLFKIAPRIRSEKSIFDTLDSSISQLNRSELFSQLDKTLENHADTESKAVLEREAEAESKAALEHDRKNWGNDFNF